MRKLLISAVTLGGLASIALCASYGWDQATEPRDRVIQAFVYGMVALFTLLLHFAAIRSWSNGWRKAGFVIGVGGFLAFVMTAFTSLGGMAVRSDVMIAGRQEVLDTKADTKRQIDELTKEKAGLTFKRTSQAVVDAAKLLADTAKTARMGECGNGDPRQRGKFCREKEEAEAKAVAALAEAQANKASTDRHDQIEVDLKKLRSQNPSGAVGAADPMKALLATMIGTWADKLTAWQKAAFVVVYDICLVLAMVGIEATGERRPLAKREEEERIIEDEVIEPVPKPVVIPKPTKPKLVASTKTPVGSVRRILTDNLESAPGKKVEIAEIGARYREVCREEGKPTASMDAFIDEVEVFCKAIGIRRRTVGGKVYLLDVQLTKEQACQAS